MPKNKDFYIYEMKSDKDDKPGAPKKTGVTINDDEPGTGTSNATAQTTGDPATPPTNVIEPGPAQDASRRTEDPPGPIGISMVQSPSIVLNPTETAAREPRHVSLLDALTTSIMDLTSGGTSSRDYSGARRSSTSSIYSNRMRRGSYDHDMDENPSPSPSLITLDKEVRRYIRTKEYDAYSYYPGTEQTIYDYMSERTGMYTTNILESTAYLIKGSIGASVLSMHEAYMIGGIWTSLGVTIFVGVLVGYTMIMLIRSAQKMYRRLRISKLSYPALAEAAFATAPWLCVTKKSKIFRHIVEVSIILQMFGACCVYQIIIANTLQQIVTSLNTDIFNWLTEIRMYILLSTPALIPLCLIRSLKYLSPFAMIADVFVAICVFTTLYYCLLAFEVEHITKRAPWKSTHGFFRVIGICMYGTSGICVALPVENNMRRPGFFPNVVRYATTIVVLLSTMTGFFGYWAWGETCTSPITRHMPPNTFTTVLQVLLVLMLSTTFAVNFWVPFRVVWHYIVRRHKRKRGIWEMMYRFFMALLVMGAAMITPNTISVMIFLGHFFLGFIGLVFPAVIELIVNLDDEITSIHRSRFKSVKNFCLIILGLALSGISIYAVRD